MGVTNLSWNASGAREESDNGPIFIFIVFAVIALGLSSISFAGARSASTAKKSVDHSIVLVADQDEPTQLASFAGKTKVLERRVRIQRIVMGLDRIEDATLQMMPENEDRLHPILEDLEERAVALSDMEKISSPDVDEELSQIEVSVKKLSSVVARMVQPEMTL